jgi:hypothetical protein
MHGLLIFSFLSMGPLAQSADAVKDHVWLKDYAQAKAKALREDKPIFVVFR